MRVSRILSWAAALVVVSTLVPVDATLVLPDIPSDFWENAKSSIGDFVQDHTRDLLRNAVALYPAVAEQIEKSKAIVNDVVEAVVQFRNVAMDHSTNSSLDGISDELENSFNSIIKLLQEEFPPPDQAPTHEERALMVSRVLTHVENTTVEVLSKYDVNEDHIRSLFHKLGPIIQDLVVVIGDIAEQHPMLIEMLVLPILIEVIAAAAEAWFLRPLLISVFGFGRYGPIKGSAAAWAQKFFWGAAVKKGSWFSWLQSAGMKY